MKKSVAFLLLTLLAYSPLKVSADEGMWTLYNLPQPV